MKYLFLLCICLAISLQGNTQNTYPWPATGNVGIGTSLPGGKALYVKANSPGDHSAVIENISSTGYGLILNSAYDPLRIGSSGDYNGGFFKVSSNGNVGIGTINPAYTLDVNGHGRFNAGLDVGGSRNVNSAIGGFNLYDYTQGTSTNIQLAQSAWGSSHAILFNAYKSNSQVNGNLGDIGNVKYSNDVGADAGGAGMIHFLANGGRMDFYITPISEGQNNTVHWPTPILSLTRGGNVGIGSYSPDARLSVKGAIHANEVKVDLTVPGPDYVFEKDYDLNTLDSVKAYIDQNKHLPEVPSAKEMEENGVNLGEMNMLLLKKIEELTLYMIDVDRRLSTLQKENENLRKLIK